MPTRPAHRTTRPCASAAIAAALLAATNANALQPVTFIWAEITNPTPGVANPPDTVVMNDTTTSYGSVAHDYRIATTAVTNAQYAAFLNAVAAVDDPHNLYRPSMAGNFGGITRAGTPGNYTYTPIQGRDNLPVVYVSFLDAMRFTNWLANGQPTGANAIGATESGAYLILDGLAEQRAPDAPFFIPSEHEWYKAAYHHPANAGGPASSYWQYPTASNTPPVAPPNANAAANFNNPTGAAVPVDTYMPNNNGLYNAAGNVWEWNEARLNDDLHRGIRGGSFAGSANFLRSNWRSSNIPTIETALIGFRVAAQITQPPTPCDCDKNSDAFQTVADWFAFLNDFFAQFDPDKPAPGSADFNNDGSVDAEDVQAYLDACLSPISNRQPCDG